jgi:hypothetical protein
LLQFIETDKFDIELRKDMSNHYSCPKGFVGRSICYKVFYNFKLYGHIVAGSATKFLPGRNEFFDWYLYNKWHLENIVNNIFFHIEPKDGKYPIRNFAQLVLSKFIELIKRDWLYKYGDEVLGFETLIELPRTGEIYKRNKWIIVGQTKGYTCKRVAGKGTDNWSGKRIWDTQNLRPKLVFCRLAA